MNIELPIKTYDLKLNEKGDKITFDLPDDTGPILIQCGVLAMVLEKGKAMAVEYLLEVVENFDEIFPDSEYKTIVTNES
ncbi:MAG: hypothetical protein AAFO91_02955 [Bacteroidota bacterium]